MIIPTVAYYLFYDLNNHTFHQPIEDEMLPKYRDLQIIDIGSLNTFGEETTELLSVQFVDKIMMLIDGNNYIFKN